jgi:hypothetical protein
MSVIYGLGLLFFLVVGMVWNRNLPLLILCVVCSLLWGGFAPLGAHGSLFGVIRLWCVCLFIFGPLWAGLVGFCLHRVAPRVAKGVWFLGILLILVGVDAFFIEPVWLQVSTVEVRSPRLKQPLRVALLADIQTDDVGQWEQSVFETMMAAKPDLIVIAGDTLQVSAAQWEEQQRAFVHAWRSAGVSAPLGVIAVQGNTDAAAWDTLYAQLGVHANSRTTRHSMGAISVTALSERESFDDHLTLSRPNRSFHLVLGHSPDFALGAVDADLLLAGHTHGGQIQLPFVGPLLTFARVPRSWASGVTALPDGGTLVVSRGIGMERSDAPRIRFLCRPELVILDLLPEKPAPDIESGEDA